MRSNAVTLSVGILVVLTVATSSSAHHAWAVDRTRSVTIKGTVTGVNWGNPHVQVFLDAKDNQGNLEKWTAGGPSPSRMAGNGWSKDTLKAGDEITAVGHRATDTPNLLRMQRVMLADGRELVGYGGR